MRYPLTILLTVLLGNASPLFAQVQNGVCAQGYVKEVTEGGWGSNDLFVQLEYTGPLLPPTWWPTYASSSAGSYMRFRSSLDPVRLSGIRTLALLAMANGNKVEVRTSQVDNQSQEDCADATEFKIFRITGN